MLSITVGWTFVAMIAVPFPSVSCEHHAGVFDNGFSADFDIDSVECRAREFENFPRVRFVGAPPYVSSVWGSDPH